MIPRLASLLLHSPIPLALTLLLACHIGSKDGDTGALNADNGCTPDSYCPLGFGEVALKGDPDDDPSSLATVEIEITSQMGGCTVPGSAWYLYCYGYDYDQDGVDDGVEIPGANIEARGSTTVVADLGPTLEELGTLSVYCELIWQDAIYYTYNVQ